MVHQSTNFHIIIMAWPCKIQLYLHSIWQNITILIEPHLPEYLNQPFSLLPSLLDLSTVRPIFKFAFGLPKRFLGIRGVVDTWGPTVGCCTMSMVCLSSVTTLPIEKFLEAEASPIILVLCPSMDSESTGLRAEHESKISHEELLRSSCSSFVKAVLFVRRPPSTWASELALGSPDFFHASHILYNIFFRRNWDLLMKQS